jgi:hypothetical protein
MFAIDSQQRVRLYFASRKRTSGCPLMLLIEVLGIDPIHC